MTRSTAATAPTPDIAPPPGASDVSEWADTDAEPFRLVYGPEWTIANAGAAITVEVFRTQRLDGSIEEQSVRIDGGDSYTDLSSRTALDLATAIAQAATVLAVAEAAEVAR
jgi:hypothetical protein